MLCQQVIDRLAQQFGTRDARLGRQLTQQVELGWFEVDGVAGLGGLAHGVSIKLPVATCNYRQVPVGTPYSAIANRWPVAYVFYLGQTPSTVRGRSSTALRPTDIESVTLRTATQHDASHQFVTA